MNREDYFEQYSWVLKVLSSCETEEQINTTEKLFKLYMKMEYQEVSKHQLIIDKVVTQKYKNKDDINKILITLKQRKNVINK